MGRKPTWFRGAYGVTEDGHLARMGTAQSLFWWAVARQTREPEPGAGWVLGGRELQRELIGRDLGVSASSVTRMLEKLTQLRYVGGAYTRTGFRLRILKQKKFPGSAEVENLDSAETPNLGSAEMHTEKSARFSTSAASRPGSADPVTCTRSNQSLVQVTNNKLPCGDKTDLFGNGQPKKPGRKPAKRSKHSLTPMADKALGFFREKYQRVHQTDYFVEWGRDRRILTNLVRGHGLDHVLERLEAFWSVKERMDRGEQKLQFNKAAHRVYGADNSIVGFKLVYDTLPTLWDFTTTPAPMETR